MKRFKIKTEVCFSDNAIDALSEIKNKRAVIITDSDHVILSAVQPETVAHRLSTKI